MTRKKQAKARPKARPKSPPRRAPGGITPSVAAKIDELLGRGESARQIAAAVKVDRRTVDRYLQRREADQAREQRLAAAREAVPRGALARLGDHEERLAMLRARVLELEADGEVAKYLRAFSSYEAALLAHGQLEQLTHGKQDLATSLGELIVKYQAADEQRRVDAPVEWITREAPRTVPQLRNIAEALERIPAASRAALVAIIDEPLARIRALTSEAA